MHCHEVVCGILRVNPGPAIVRVPLSEGVFIMIHTIYYGLPTSEEHFSPGLLLPNLNWSPEKKL